MKIMQLLVNTPQGEAGTLDKDSRFVFNYRTGERGREVSLTMPIRSESYASGALLTPFAMNKPEGWLYQQIIARMAKHEHIDDMRLLAITGSNQIRRLSADVCHVRNPEQVIERIASAMSESLIANRGRIDATFLTQIEREWDAGRLAVTQTPQTAR